MAWPATVSSSHKGRPAASTCLIPVKLGPDISPEPTRLARKHANRTRGASEQVQLAPIGRGHLTTLQHQCRGSPQRRDSQARNPVLGAGARQVYMRESGQRADSTGGAPPHTNQGSLHRDRQGACLGAMSRAWRKTSCLPV